MKKLILPFLTLMITNITHAKAGPTIDLKTITQEEWRDQSEAYAQTLRPKTAPTLFQNVLETFPIHDEVFTHFFMKIFPCIDGEDTDVAFSTYEELLRKNPELTLRATAENYLDPYDKRPETERVCLSEDNSSSVFAATLSARPNSGGYTVPQTRIATQESYQKAKQALSQDPSFKKVLAPIFEAIEQTM